MLEFFDYSNRRGVMVQFLPGVHALLLNNSQKDKLACLPPPEHIITWQQRLRNELLDINRRFLIAVNKTEPRRPGEKNANVAGVFFYRYSGNDIYIEELQIAWDLRNDPQVLEGLMKKLEFDIGTKEVTFFAGERIKVESDKEQLAAKLLTKTNAENWENLGNLKAAINALKFRYNRS